MVNIIRYHQCAYASRASMAQRDNRSEMDQRQSRQFRIIFYGPSKIVKDYY